MMKTRLDDLSLRLDPEKLKAAAGSGRKSLAPVLGGLRRGAGVAGSAAARVGASAWRWMGPRLARAPGTAAGSLKRSLAGAQTSLSRALTPGPSRKVQKLWTEQLEELGAMDVRERLDGVEMLNTGPQAKVRFVDAGVTHGTHRFPSRAFVEAWLGDGPEEDLGAWRVLVILALGLVAIAAGVLYSLGAF